MMYNPTSPLSVTEGVSVSYEAPIAGNIVKIAVQLDNGQRGYDSQTARICNMINLANDCLIYDGFVRSDINGP